MRLLFEIDTKNYKRNGTSFSRPSARSIILRDGKIGMVHSLKYNYYKLPGGGIESGETQQDALIRETLEETGLIVLPESIRPYGYVHRIQKGKREDMFIQDNYYYFCEVAPHVAAQNLSASEAEADFVLEFVSLKMAISANQPQNHPQGLQIMLERENRVLELLSQEGYLNAD